jgi:hypothetical protein
MENWLGKQLVSYSHLGTLKIQNLELMSHGMMHIVNYIMEFLRLDIFSTTKCRIQM